MNLHYLNIPTRKRLSADLSRSAVALLVVCCVLERNIAYPICIRVSTIPFMMLVLCERERERGDDVAAIVYVRWLIDKARASYYMKFRSILIKTLE